MPITQRLTAATRAALPNGKFGKHLNGHAKDSAPSATPDEAVNPAEPDLAPQARARAAADEDHGVSLRASDPPAAAPPAASTDRAAYAAAARDSNQQNIPKECGAAKSGDAKPSAAKSDEAPRSEASRSEVNPDAARRGASKAKRRGAQRAAAEAAPTPVPPARGLLPASAATFAEALNAQADFLEVGRRLLNSNDERVIRGVWEHMLELRYGQEAAPPVTGTRRLVIDMPQPER